MTSFRRPDEIVTASRRAMKKVIYNSDPISSTVTSTCLPTVLGKTDTSSLQFSLPKLDMPPMVRHPVPGRIKAEHLQSLPPVIVETLVRLFTWCLSQCKLPTLRETSKPCCCIRREFHTTLSRQ
uniref:Uncharacterized protein n=1 Tax=Haemonchus contortus TaxID=6289 RepID=A0A7I4YN86_HAECO